MVDRHVEDDLRAVLYPLMRMIKICPGVLNSFHANGIEDSLHQFYFATTSREMFPFVSLLVFIILYFANIEALTEEDLWLWNWSPGKSGNLFQYYTTTFLNLSSSYKYLNMQVLDRWKIFGGK